MIGGEWPGWDNLTAFANSEFVTALLGSLAGAAGGALAAQRIAERAKLREHLLEQIRNSNASIEIAFGICNTCLSLKEQHVKALKERYEEQRAGVHAHDEGLENGTIPPGTPLYVGEIDLRSLDAVRVRIEKLESIVMEKLSVTGRPRPLVGVLLQSIASLNNSIRQRNEVVAWLKNNDIPMDQRTRLMFGLKMPGGHIDHSYGDLIRGIYRQVDDCIYFSKLLCSDLSDHADECHREYKRRFRGRIPVGQQILWENAERKGLMPDPADYESWSRAFIRRVPASRRRWVEKSGYLLRREFRRPRRALMRIFKGKSGCLAVPAS